MIPETLVLAVSTAADGTMTPSSPENRVRFLKSLNLDPARLATCVQVHGTEVKVASGPAIHAATDALVTGEPGLPLLILGADCPLLCLHDEAGAAVAVVHAGWRGMAAGILAQAMAALAPKDPRTVRAFISSCAGPCCYEVGEEVAERFPQEAVSRPAPGSNAHLNLHRAAELALGIPITPLGPTCTICTDTHFSYRRTATPGRHALVAALRRV